MTLRVTRVQIEGSCGYIQQADEVVVTFTLSRNESAGLPCTPLSDEAHNAVTDWLDYIVEVESK